ncbi:MAG: hypothetical protein ACE37F_35485 [Nannocystaceae bacterium]|nr:hypothetical protein [bacterium]
MGEIRVHIDTLKYTRSGLATRTPLDVTVGEHNRVVLVRPTRRPSAAASYGGFPEGVSFPGPAVLSLLHHEHMSLDSMDLLRDRPKGAKLQIFAHCDAAGSEADNKALSDRRARATHALMTRDVPVMLDVASAEDWPPEIGQVMLRSLGHDPGPIDGKFEELTSTATRAFQEDYAAGVFHRDRDTLHHAQLEADGELGPKTMEALIDAYVSKWSPEVPPEQFLEAHPLAGCGANNAAFPSRDNPGNRRVSLVVHAQAPEFPDATTCREGDPMACPVVDEALHRCMWYREHVAETPHARAVFHLFEPSWLRLPNGGHLLSVLTNVPDEESVVFEVFRAASVVGPSGLGDDVDLGGLVMEAVTVSPVLGVAQVVLAPTAAEAIPELDRPVMEEFGQEIDVPTFRATHPRSGARIHAPLSRPRIVVLFQSRARAAGTFDQLELELIADGRSSRTPARAARPYADGYDAVTFSDFGQAESVDLLAHAGEGAPRVLLAGAKLIDLERIESSPGLVPTVPDPPQPAGAVPRSVATAPPFQDPVIL